MNLHSSPPSSTSASLTTHFSTSIISTTNHILPPHLPLKFSTNSNFLPIMFLSAAAFFYFPRL